MSDQERSLQQPSSLPGNLQWPRKLERGHAKAVLRAKHSRCENLVQVTDDDDDYDDDDDDDDDDDGGEDIIILLLSAKGFVP